MYSNRLGFSLLHYGYLITLENAHVGQGTVACDENEPTAR